MASQSLELKAVPWSEEEELSFVTTNSSVDEMFLGLILEAVNIHDQYYPNLASSKAFGDSVRRALNQSFEVSLMYLSCSYFWTDRKNVQTAAMTNARHLTWLIERMVELRIGEADMNQWIDQDSSTDAVMEVIRGYERREVALGLTAHVIRCTCKFADAVASGSINLADRQVRMKLIKDWLQLLTVSKEKVLPIFGMDESTYLDLEATFLRIISTLPMADSQELLKQCIRLSTLNVEESSHLLSAFNAWFRRAAQPSD